MIITNYIIMDILLYLPLKKINKNGTIEYIV
uniref:Uncharacterized protein n=1 Tax=viral metagenome TaxID=1070528 RepID=A0A6C0LUI3_9ZZZZ